MTNNRIVKWTMGCLLLLICNHTPAQVFTGTEIEAAAKKQLKRGLTDLVNFLSIPNNGRFSEDVQNNLRWCKERFDALGFETRVLETEGEPLLFAQQLTNREKPTVLFYLQIDGQPVDSSKWLQPNPYQAQAKALKDGTWTALEPDWLEGDIDSDWRLFARSASDSKGPAMAFMHSLALLRESDFTPEFNIKVIMDFQEELGSPHLPAAVLKHKALFEADRLLIMDGTRHLSNLPTLTFGARGIATITLKVFGARRDLHSGQYGNYAPNPVFKLATLIAGMKDEAGKVTIPGYYEGVGLSDEEKKLLNSLPEDEKEIKASLGIANSDKVGITYQESLQYPSLNVRGLRAAWVGQEVRTLIPSEAIAEFDLRLVPESPGERQVALIKKYIADQGFHFVDDEPTDKERQQYDRLASFKYRIGSKPFRTDLNSDLGNWLSLAMTRAFGAKGFVKMRTTGGSQPMAPFINTLGVPAVSVRIPNPDNSIHAPNENLRIGNFLEGIQMCLAILTQH